MLSDRYYLALCKAKLARKKIGFDSLINDILANPRTAPIYPEEIARPILRALSKRAAEKNPKTHEAICLYGARLSRANAIFLIRYSLRTSFDLAISGPPGKLGQYMADFLDNGPISYDDLVKSGMSEKARNIRSGNDINVTDEEMSYVTDYLSAYDAAPGAPSFCDPHNWENNIANWCTEIKPTHLENSEQIINGYTQDNPKLYMNPEFQKYEAA